MEAKSPVVVINKLYSLILLLNRDLSNYRDSWELNRAAPAAWVLLVSPFLPMWESAIGCSAQLAPRGGAGCIVRYLLELSALFHVRDNWLKDNMLFVKDPKSKQCWDWKTDHCHWALGSAWSLCNRFFPPFKQWIIFKCEIQHCKSSQAHLNFFPSVPEISLSRCILHACPLFRRLSVGCVTLKLLKYACWPTCLMLCPPFCKSLHVTGPWNGHARSGWQGASGLSYYKGRSVIDLYSFFNRNNFSS